MLSINIPVFNIEVNSLVLELVRQAEKLKIPYEIRVYDDGSEEAVKIMNRKIAKLPKVVYSELSTNLGRASIRNKMGIESVYKYLLFLDADSKLVKDNYLTVFLENTRPGCVLCGGTSYRNEKPAENEKILRWTYGTKREAISAKIRSGKKGFIITSNNFWIEKRVFERFHFRENIRNYGHEDTVLGFDLFRNGIQIEHIDNPVEHTGLEDAEVFLQKSRLAMKNLKYIVEEVLKNDKDFIRQVNFLNRYYSLTKWFPQVLLQVFYFLFHSLLEHHLKGRNPWIPVFDLYKLSFFSSIKKP
jgi:glycosyltransferase involved in cell wall biosynthesis